MILTSLASLRPPPIVDAPDCCAPTAGAITVEAIAASDTAAVDSQLTGTERAFAMAIDGVHGISSQVMPGDRVDVYINVNGTTKLFEPNVKVITTPTVPGPAGGGNLILQIDTKDAARWLFAADNSQLIFVLRPVIAAKPTKRSQANAATLLR